MDQDGASRKQNTDDFPAFRELENYLINTPYKFRAYIMVTMINEAHKFDDGRIQLNHKFPTIIMYHHLKPLEKVLLFATFQRHLSNLADHIEEEMGHDGFRAALSKAYADLNPYETGAEDIKVSSDQYQHIFDNKFEIEDIVDKKEGEDGEPGES